MVLSETHINLDLVFEQLLLDDTSTFELHVFLLLQMNP